VQMDVFLRYPIPFDELATRATTMTVGDIRFKVSSREDLILAKSQVKPLRTVDRRDIEDLQKLIERDEQS
jgi:hypothetical protein